MAHDDQSGMPRGGGNASSPVVMTLAEEVLTVLRHRKTQTGHVTPPEMSDLLWRHILASTPFDARSLLELLRNYGVPVTALVDELIPAAARALGEGWCNDSLTFVEVTLGSAHLQSLLSEAIYSSQITISTVRSPLKVQIVKHVDDQHTLGALVLAAQLRREGALVELCTFGSARVAARNLLDAAPHAVLFSCSRSVDLDFVSQIARNVRSRAVTGPCLILGGPVLGFCTNVKETTDVDHVTNDAAVVMNITKLRRAGWSEMALL